MLGHAKLFLQSPSRPLLHQSRINCNAAPSTAAVQQKKMSPAQLLNVAKLAAEAGARVGLTAVVS
jgi:hypothetical protein